MWEMLVGPISNLIGDTLKRVLPPEKMAEADRMKLEAELKLAIMAADNTELQTRMSAILAEAKSADPWTSRARPSFLYVIYVLILASVPMGILSAFEPNIALAIANGMKAWLGAIPDMLWGTFGAGYLGYSAARSFDKKQILSGKI